LAEDIGYEDITTNALIDSKQRAEGRVVCKENAVVAGIEEALVLLKLAGCQGTAAVRDGYRVKAETMILSARGPARALLTVERTLLNILAHMSGVATATADLVSIAKRESRGNVRIACTRKTHPGLRYFEKRAVELGGGDTHRLRLDDAVLIKDNHLELAGSVSACVRKAKERVSFTKKVEVEVTTADQAVEAAQAGADIVLLDNMTPKEVRSSTTLLVGKGLRNRVLVEASGGIRKENLPSYAKTGVDVISVGVITQSASAIDMSLEIRASRTRG
jgi:nicotinate-nucleotide pyrophosphorylase (carboxylating)